MTLSSQGSKWNTVLVLKIVFVEARYRHMCIQIQPNESLYICELHSQPVSYLCQLLQIARSKRPSLRTVLVPAGGTPGKQYICTKNVELMQSRAFGRPVRYWKGETREG